jgi:acetolactate synthase-1/2/3 large subunit
MAESYGAIGMRATKPQEVMPMLEEAMKIDDRPVVMDFWVEKEENVYPMVPAGASLLEMVEGDE